jgi:cytochrome c5
MLRLCLIFILITGLAHAASHHPQDFLHRISGEKEQGKKIYEHFCANCHADRPLISLGAPRLKNADDWNFRIKRGLKTLFRHTDEGLNAMPPRGGCFECSDEQLLAAILYLLPDKTIKAHKKHSQ